MKDFGEKKEYVKMTNYVKDAMQFKLSSNERYLLDYLIYRQTYNRESNALKKPFACSYKKFEKSLLISKHTIMEYISKFKKIGFLNVYSISYNSRKQYFIDFSKLADPNILKIIIKPNTKTFDEFLENYKMWANKQSRK